MRIEHVSQSELARRIKVSQQAVSRLISGEVRGSKHLHLIARELGTTPAYLTGETDDPNEDAPPAPDISAEEQEWLELMRSLAPRDRAAVMQLTRTIATSAPSGVVNAPTMEFHGEERR